MIISKHNERWDKMKHLNQIIATEKGIKSRTYSQFTDINKISSKLDLFIGFAKTYKKKDEEAEDYPPEKKKVTQNVNEIIKMVIQTLSEMLDITCTKDMANCKAFADIIVDGNILVKQCPATYLLFLEKQINDIRTFVENLPTLDESEDWTLDVNSELYKTEPIQTHRTKKVQKPIILAEATKEHPAQCQMITEDIVVGYWDTIKFSGAMPLPRKKEILYRIEKFASAVKCAREKANMVEVEEEHVASTIFNYIFKI
jgi:hypothetical protein